MRLLYQGLFWLALPLILLRLLWRARRQPEYLQHIGERFGISRRAHRAHRAHKEAPVWIHAVSVGETRAAEPLIRAIRQRHPDLPILLTCTTPTGRATAQQLFGEDVRLVYLPYDLAPAVARFLRTHRPRIGVLMETELWPELMFACDEASIPLYVINARLSERSARRYMRVRGFMARVLACTTTIAAQSDADAQRLRVLGAHSVLVCGNMKFDRSAAPEDIALAQVFRRNLGARKVVLAASSRQGEEALLLDAWRALAPVNAMLALVPRHPQRFDELASLIEQRGFSCARRSAVASPGADVQVWLGDSMGEMFAYYAACDVALIGGSFLEFGGQNLLEACAVAKPFIVGPHMFNFTQATQLALEAHAGLQVSSFAQAVEMADKLLRDDAQRKQMGEAGRALMQTHQGATRRILEMLEL